MLGMRRETIPHVITASRLVIVLAAYVPAWYGDAALVVGLALLAVATDILDGILARRWGVASTFGSNLDSASDFVFYASLIPWVYLFRPEVILAILPFVVAYLVLYVATLALAKTRRGAMGLHNAWTRTTATVGVTIALWTILFGWSDLFLWALLIVLTSDLGQRLAKILRSTRGGAADVDPVER